MHAYMDAHVEKAIQRRRLQEQAKKDATQGTNRYIFSDELVKLTDDRLTLRDQLLGIFFAGRDTTAALLSNLFFVLAQNPQLWKRLHREIDTINGRNPTLDELKGLQYLNSCLNESQISLIDSNDHVADMHTA